MPRKTNSKLHVREIKPEEMQVIYPLIKQLNPDMTKREFTAFLKEMLAINYRCAGAFRAGKLLGAMGFWTQTRFWTGRFLELDNVVVDAGARGLGIGKNLSDWIDAEAKRLGCTRVLADVFTHSKAAHRFYIRERYDILGFSFGKSV